MFYSTYIMVIAGLFYNSNTIIFETQKLLLSEERRYMDYKQFLETVEKKVREKIIDNKWLKGVVSMPSNIFANTGTNVSVLFIDKSNTEGEVMLVDASKMGTKVKDGKNQRTVLSDEEVVKIENTFINQDVVDDFSVKVTYDDIKNKNYSLSAGQYFEVKIEYVELSEEEFEEKMDTYKSNLEKYFTEGKNLEEEIMEGLEMLSYE